MINLVIRRGDIYYADLRPVVGSEQGGIRPVIVVQNEAGNKHSSTVIIAAITSKMKRPKLPTHIMLDSARCDIAKDSSFSLFVRLHFPMRSEHLLFYSPQMLL